MRLAPAAVLALCLLLPAAAAAAGEKAPLTVKEKYADRFVNDPGFGWDTVPLVRVKAAFTVPLDPLFTGPEAPGTALAFSVGMLDFDSTLGEADRYVPGKSARWTVLDDFTGKPFMKVRALWKKGVLKVAVSTRGEDGALSDDYVLEEDLVIAGDPFDGSLSFGWADYEFEGTLSGRADTTVKRKAGDEYDISKVSLAGSAAITERPEDLEDPSVEIFDPFEDDELDTAETGIDWYAGDDTSLALLEYRVNGGPWTPLPAEVVVDPDFGDASAEGILLLDTSTEGSYTVEIRVVDAFGKEGTASVTFTVAFG